MVLVKMFPFKSGLGVAGSKGHFRVQMQELGAIPFVEGTNIGSLAWGICGEIHRRTMGIAVGPKTMKFRCVSMCFVGIEPTWSWDKYRGNRWEYHGI